MLSSRPQCSPKWDRAQGQAQLMIPLPATRPAAHNAQSAPPDRNHRSRARIPLRPNQPTSSSLTVPAERSSGSTPPPVAEGKNVDARTHPQPADSISRNRPANSLDMRRNKFHYSVIDGHASDSQAAQNDGCNSTNAHVSALNFAAAALPVLCGGSLRPNWIGGRSSLLQPDPAMPDFVPIKERFMQMTAVPKPQCESL